MLGSRGLASLFQGVNTSRLASSLCATHCSSSKAHREGECDVDADEKEKDASPVEQQVNGDPDTTRHPAAWISEAPEGSAGWQSQEYVVEEYVVEEEEEEEEEEEDPTPEELYAPCTFEPRNDAELYSMLTPMGWPAILSVRDEAKRPDLSRGRRPGHRK